MVSVEKELQGLRERNRRVEADKAWETSRTRRGLIALFTYLVLGLYLCVIDIPRPWLNAIVPTVGFLLSTLTMPWFEKLWLRRLSRKSPSKPRGTKFLGFQKPCF